MNRMNFSSPITFKAPRDGALPTRIEGNAYGGGVVPGYGVVIDLDSTEIVAPMQALAEHNRQACAGVIETATKKAGQLLVGGKLFSDIVGSEGEKIAQRAQRGAPYQLSVGLFHYSEEFIGRDQSATVNGRALVGPLTVLRNGKVREVSIVALGADSDAKARLFDSGRVRAPAIDTREIYRRHNSGYWG